ncbi:MAG: mechanosensitive ion channel [Deltaproteobacteria bacterium]|nr:mechanosensitive ion channel [Deltaproteobacteria bacterium]
MNEMTQSALRPMELFWSRLIDWSPRIVLVLALLAAGLIAASLSRRLGQWLIRRTGLEALAERLGIAEILYSLGLHHGLSVLVGRLLQGGVLLLTLATVAEVLGLPGFAEGVGVLLEFLPKVITAALIVLGGMATADLLGRMATRFGRAREDLESSDFFGRIARYGVLTVTYALAAQQLGLELALVNLLIAITVAAVLFGLGLAFALGSRVVVESFLAGHYAKRLFRVGDTIRVGELEGEVVRYTAVAMLLRDREGLHAVPLRDLIGNAVYIVEDPV